METATILSPLGSPIKTSFFDDNSETAFFSPGTKKNLWIPGGTFTKLAEFYKLPLSETKLYEGTLYQRKAKTGLLKAETIQLFQDRLQSIKV